MFKIIHQIVIHLFSGGPRSAGQGKTGQNLHRNCSQTVNHPGCRLHSCHSQRSSVRIRNSSTTHESERKISQTKYCSGNPALTLVTYKLICKSMKVCECVNTGKVYYCISYYFYMYFVYLAFILCLLKIIL